MLFLISKIIFFVLGSIGSALIEKDDSKSTIFNVKVSDWISLLESFILYSKTYDCNLFLSESWGVTYILTFFVSSLANIIGLCVIFIPTNEYNLNVSFSSKFFIVKSNIAGSSNSTRKLFEMGSDFTSKFIAEIVMMLRLINIIKNRGP